MVENDYIEHFEGTKGVVADQAWACDITFIRFEKRLSEINEYVRPDTHIRGYSDDVPYGIKITATEKEHHSDNNLYHLFLNNPGLLSGLETQTHVTSILCQTRINRCAVCVSCRR